MAESLFFYDLETSGTNPRTARIMQFAGQRTDMDLNPIGDEYNILVKLTEDTLPEPDAILVTGITPQKTIAEGISEAEFFQIFSDEIVQRGTVFVGFNNVRFDDEFMRFGLYRNFYDAYEWQWKDDRSRWDILDLSRMMRALRPDGIEWPFAPDGKPSNRLELLTAVNGLDHADAHDALSDVRATIAVARAIKERQQKLYDYAFKMRDKKEVEKLVCAGEPFVYVSGKYPHEYHKTAVVQRLGAHPKKAASFVYDLRHDPTQYLELSPEELAEAWRYQEDPEALRLPIKTLQYNKCPAVAPMSVLRDEDMDRLQVDKELIAKHRQILQKASGFYENVVKAAEIIEAGYEQTEMVPDVQNVDSALYDGFVNDGDRRVLPDIHKSSPDELSKFKDVLKDERLKHLVSLYKARNYPKSLTDDERKAWEQFRTDRLRQAFPGFLKRLQELSEREGLSGQEQYLIEELHLYAQSIVPEDN